MKIYRVYKEVYKENFQKIVRNESYNPTWDETRNNKNGLNNKRIR